MPYISRNATICQGMLLELDPKAKTHCRKCEIHCRQREVGTYKLYGEIFLYVTNVLFCGWTFGVESDARSIPGSHMHRLRLRTALE